MTILQIHKYYWQRDGASNYALMLSELLRGNGHSIIPFAMQHEKNIASPYQKYFVRERDLSDPRQANIGEKIRIAANMIYSHEAKRNMQELLRNIDNVRVAHVHNIYHHITPSIFPVLKKKGIKIVMTLHDYKLLAPNYTLFHHGEIHEEDARGWYLSCVQNACMKESRMQSAIVTAEMIWHHKIMKYYERYVDQFIAPSRFAMNLCMKFGWNEEKFVHIPHPMAAASSVSTHDEGYIAYVGRLSEEKGINVLVSAAKLIGDIPIKLIGDGPMRMSLQKRVAEEGVANIEFAGFQSGDALQRYIEGARVMVLPSVWYENYPLSILEAKAAGKIIIGSNIGGIPELLPHDLLADPGNPEQLAEQLRVWYSSSLSRRKEKGEALRQDVLRNNNREDHLAAIESLYRAL